MCVVMKMYMWFKTGLTLRVVKLGGSTHTKPLTSNLSPSYSGCGLNSVPDLKGIATFWTVRCVKDALYFV